MVRHWSTAIAKITVRVVLLLSTVIRVVDSVRYLGVIIDSQLCIDAHVAALCRGGYYQLRQLRPIIRSLSTKAAETLVHAFVSSRLDYCNALLSLKPDGLYRSLYSPSRTPRRDLYPGYGSVITSGQPYYDFTGYPYDSEYCSRSLSWSTSV